MSKILVIRCSSIDRVDPIAELDAVIAKRGTAWFGKYGQTFAAFPYTQEERLVVLAGNNRMQMHGQGAAYRLLERSILAPADKSSYPSYYCGKLHRISTWLKLEPAASPRVDLSYLVVLRSGQPVKAAMSTSMVGHFWCTSIAPAHSAPRKS